jgi:hypothetical protein
MEDRRSLWSRIGTVIGLLSLGSMLAIMPLGVRAVRAGDETEALMSVDPLLVAGERATLPAQTATSPDEAEEGIKPGSDRVEPQPGVIVLNMRGYNYGQPPSALDPAAMKRESPPAR